jgi:hypothetical protein
MNGKVAGPLNRCIYGDHPDSKFTDEHLSPKLSGKRRTLIMRVATPAAKLRAKLSATARGIARFCKSAIADCLMHMTATRAALLEQLAA